MYRIQGTKLALAVVSIINIALLFWLCGLNPINYWSEVRLLLQRTILVNDNVSALSILLEPAKSPCSPDNNTLIIMVKSAAAEFEARMAVRQSWGQRSRDLGVPVVFALGLDRDEITRKAVEEARQFDDILMVDFVEHYQNVSLKTYSMILWQQLRCPAINWVLNADSDVLVFPENLLRFIAQTSTDVEQKVLFGRCWDGTLAIRDTSAKWYVPYKSWPLKTYPRYCGGPSYLMNGSVPPLLLKFIQSIAFVENFHVIDDVLFTGVLTELAGVSVRNHPGFSIEEKNFDPCNKDVISSHSWKPPVKFLEGWASNEEKRLRCNPTG